MLTKILYIWRFHCRYKSTYLYFKVALHFQEFHQLLFEVAYETVDRQKSLHIMDDFLLETETELLAITKTL